jgi:NAD(P)-dependent dehydrogenase (short-subunit alcohol dehydrogenase family)
VLVHYKRSADQAESLVAAITSKGGRAHTRKADRSAPDGPTLLARGARAIMGERLDVFVSNAGVSEAAPLSDYVVDDFGAYVPGHLTKRGFVPFAILWPRTPKGVFGTGVARF